MEWYLEHRFFMDDVKTRNDNAWINRPIIVVHGKPRSTDDWFCWKQMLPKAKRSEESLNEWIMRVAPPAIEHLLDPEYPFIKDAPAMTVTLTSFLPYVGIQKEVFGREGLVSHTVVETFDDFCTMYVLRLRHDCYEMPIRIPKLMKKTPNDYINMFCAIPRIYDPPTKDVDGFYWMHPAVPEDTEDTKYFWNAIFRGEKFEYTDFKGREHLSFKHVETKWNKS